MLHRRAIRSSVLRVTVTAVLATAGVVASTGAPAGSTPASGLVQLSTGRHTDDIAGVDDPVHDVADSRGDAKRVVVQATESTVSFTAALVKPTNPKADANYKNALSGVLFYIDTNDNGLLTDAVDREAILYGDAQANLHVAVGTVNLSHLFCTGTGEFVAGVGLRGSFAKSGCLPTTTKTIRWGLIMSYHGTSGQQEDFVPIETGPLAKSLGLVSRTGYWMLAGDGNVYGFGAAANVTQARPFATAIASTFDGRGYRVVDAAGNAKGTTSNAPYTLTTFSLPTLRSGEIITSISLTPSAEGYWLFSNKGRVFAYGDAKSFGDMSAVTLSKPIIASIATPTGLGYFMVASDGGIFAFGDAKFHGSMGGVHLNRPVVGIAPTADNTGYWLVASDGGVFAFNAPFRGSLGGTKLNKPIVGMVSFGNGYLMVASDGGVFDFSNKPFLGSLAGRNLPYPIIGITAFSV